MAPGGVPGVADLLALAVAGIGGSSRPGQVTMANAVARAIETGEHLAVQAGTGTGKSLAYLVPAARHAVSGGGTVVVSTATIALQRQLVERDLPRLAEALAPALGRAPAFAILKGRRNYLCLMRLRGGPQDDAGQALFDPGQASAIGRQVQRLHEWAATTSSGDRDELVPGVSDQAWRQVSVSARECLGAQRCPFGTQCHAELARDRAGRADIVVTNHALLAIDAMEDFGVLPEHDVVIVDEAHDLVDRVTSVASGELSPAGIEAAARRCGRGASTRSTRRSRRAWRRCGTPRRGARQGSARPAPRARRSLAGPPRAGPRSWPWTSWRRRRAGCSARSARTPPGGPRWSGWTGRRRRSRPGPRRCGSPRWPSAGCWPAGSSAPGPSCSPRRPSRWADRSSRWPGSGGWRARAARSDHGPHRRRPGGKSRRRPPARRRPNGRRSAGRALTWAPRSTTRAAGSSTSPGTFPRQAATACPRRTWTRSPG